MLIGDLFKDEIDEVLEPIDDIRRDMAQAAADKGRGGKE